MTLDPVEWIDKATEFVQEAGRQAEAVVKKVPAKKVDAKQAEADLLTGRAASEAREYNHVRGRVTHG